MESSANELLRLCTGAILGGADFPTVWQTILRRHPLVIGVPVQRMVGERTQLHVRLMTGQWLVFDSATREFHIS